MAKAFGNFPLQRDLEADRDERGGVRTKRRIHDRLDAAELLKRAQAEAAVETRRTERKEKGLLIIDIELFRLSKDAMDREVWSGQTSETDRPTLDHPQILDLVSTYGAYYENGEISFPEFLPNGKTRRVSTSRKAAVTPISPLAGRRSFEDVQVTVRKVVFRQGNDIEAEYATAGLISTRLPAGAPGIAPPAGHAWRCFVSHKDVARSAGGAGAAATVIAEVTVEFRSGYYPRELYDPWYAS